MISIVSKKALATTLALGALASPAFAAGSEDAAPTRAQVEELQKQLAAMQKEMQEMQASLRASEAKGAGGSMMPMMNQHMQGMQHHWQMMHDQACRMAPGTCPGMMGQGPPANR